jgi:hypothetical protein
MDALPNELIQYIIQFVPIKQRIETRLVSSRFCDNFFCHDLVEIKRGAVYNNNKVIDRAIEIFGRININLRGCDNITDVSVSKLGNVYSLDLSGCKRITDASVSKLGNVYSLNLTGCDNITDASVSKLGNVHSLNLFGCNNITDASVSKLGNVHSLNLSGCYKITNTSIQLLRDKGVNVIR